jgi:transposase
MAARLNVVLTDEQRVEIEERDRAARDAETRTRYQMILLAADGKPAPQIGWMTRRSEDTVRRVLGRFLHEGADAVPRRSPPGRAVEVTDEWLTELRRVIDLDPRTVGVPSAVWTTRLLSGYLERATGHAAAIETVRIYLHRLGYVCKRPTWSLKRKASQQAGWVKNACGWRCS